MSLIDSSPKYVITHVAEHFHSKYPFKRNFRLSYWHKECLVCLLSQQRLYVLSYSCALSNQLQFKDFFRRKRGVVNFSCLRMRKKKKSQDWIQHQNKWSSICFIFNKQKPHYLLLSTVFPSNSNIIFFCLYRQTDIKLAFA